MPKWSIFQTFPTFLSSTNLIEEVPMLRPTAVLSPESLESRLDRSRKSLAILEF